MSLVMRTSPSLKLSGGNSWRKPRIVRGAVPIKEGILFDAWAIEYPAASVITQAKSLDSRTIDEKDVLTRAAAASSTIEINLCQISSRVIPFKGVGEGLSSTPLEILASGSMIFCIVSTHREIAKLEGTVYRIQRRLARRYDHTAKNGARRGWRAGQSLSISRRGAKTANRKVSRG